VRSTNFELTPSPATTILQERSSASELGPSERVSATMFIKHHPTLGFRALYSREPGQQPSLNIPSPFPGPVPHIQREVEQGFIVHANVASWISIIATTVPFDTEASQNALSTVYIFSPQPTASSSKRRAMPLHLPCPPIRTYAAHKEWTKPRITTFVLAPRAPLGKAKHFQQQGLAKTRHQNFFELLRFPP